MSDRSPTEVEAKPEEVEAKPESVAEVIRRARGRFKRPPGGKSFAEEMAEYKREEIALEESKLERRAKAALLPVKPDSSREAKVAR